MNLYSFPPVLSRHKNMTNILNSFTRIISSFSLLVHYCSGVVNLIISGLMNLLGKKYQYKMKTSELPINSITLRFNENQHDLEKEYQTHSFNRNLQHIRTCHWLAILFYCVFFLMDYSIISINLYTYAIIRFGIVSPLFGIGIFLTYFKWYEHIYKYMLAFYVLLTAGGYIFMSINLPNSIHFVYFVGIIVCLIFCYTFIRLPFKYASLSGLFVICMYWTSYTVFKHLSGEIFSICLFYLIGINPILMIICYTAERTDRYNFYLSWQLAKKQKTIQEINSNLERAFEQRNVELQNVKDALKKIKTLSGLLPICSNCKKIRDDEGYWQQVERYVTKHTEAVFSHGICPDCLKKLYPDFADQVLDLSEE